ncbi:MAG: hypothetical protein GY841_17215 [FCB group bacterium]|nr:hypothetical protein [FCB group bacterium]
MSEDKNLEAMADAVVDSAGNSRLIIIVIVFASILTFISFWNSRDDGWMEHRLEIARQACLIAESKIQPDSLSGIARKSYYQARSFYIKKGFDHDRLVAYITNLEALRTERVLHISIPFVGIIIDVNDLGLFSGVTFAVILIWFSFHSRKELNNLNFAFEALGSNKDQMKKYYCYIGMRQVFTTPPMPKKPEDVLPWRWVMYVMAVLPLIVHAIIVLHDIGTLSSIFTNPPHAQLSTILGAITLVFVAILTFLCLYLSYKIDQAWKVAFKRIMTPDEG